MLVPRWEGESAAVAHSREGRTRRGGRIDGRVDAVDKVDGAREQAQQGPRMARATSAPARPAHPMAMKLDGGRGAPRVRLR